MSVITFADRCQEIKKICTSQYPLRTDIVYHVHKAIMAAPQKEQAKLLAYLLESYGLSKVGGRKLKSVKGFTPDDAEKCVHGLIPIVLPIIQMAEKTLLDPVEISQSVMTLWAKKDSKEQMTIMLILLNELAPYCPLVGFKPVRANRKAVLNSGELQRAVLRFGSYIRLGKPTIFGAMDAANHLMESLPTRVLKATFLSIVLAKLASFQERITPDPMSLFIIGAGYLDQSPEKTQKGDASSKAPGKNGSKSSETSSGEEVPAQEGNSSDSEE